MLKKIIIWTIVVLAAIQLIPVDRTNKPIDKKLNFVDVMHTPTNIQTLLKNACYDCHSNETVYPDYAYIAPLSWAVKDHVNEGREHLNFSEWASFNQDLKKNMLENTVADIQQNRMPIAGYMVYHPTSRLSEADKKILADYFDAILKSGKY